MSKNDLGDYVLAVLLLPFVVSLAFWVTPWLGWPSLFVGLLLWIGAVLKIAEKK